MTAATKFYDENHMKRLSTSINRWKTPDFPVQILSGTGSGPVNQPTRMNRPIPEHFGRLLLLIKQKTPGFPGFRGLRGVRRVGNRVRRKLASPAMVNFLRVQKFIVKIGVCIPENRHQRQQVLLYHLYTGIG